MADQNCPSVEELSDFLVGKLPDEVYESIAEHVEQCAACQGTVPNLAVPDETFLSRFIGPAVENPLEEESACRRAVAAIERFGLDPIFSTEGANRNDAATGLIVRQIGPYDILEELGAGGMGAVYKALHTKLQKVVAVKVLPPESLKNPGAVARFEREMVAVGRLSHPHIVGATDAGESDGTHFLVMEYVDGCDLAALVRQHGPLGIPEACELVRQAAVGLQYAHEHGMVHRDVKPSNLILSTEGTVKILDLGLALLEERLDESGSVTASGTVMGSLDYMAPEQAEDSHAVDIRSDVYSLGATLCTLLTGHPPYHGEKFRGVMQKLHALATLDPPVLEELHSRLPAELAQLIERMLAKNPADRPATPGEVAELLAPFAAGPRLETLVSGSRGERDGTASTASLIDGVSAAKTPTVITPPSPAPSECPPRRFTPKRVLLAALAAVLLLGAGIVFHIRTDQGELIVTSDDPDVEITVRRHGGDIVENIELSQGRGETKLRSGAYELIVKGADADSFIVRPDVVTLKRGEEVRATVTLKSTGTPAEAGEKPALAVKPATPAPPWQPTPEQQAFLDQVAGLPAEEQVQAVAKKLMEVNPGFDGSVQHRIEADNVISLAFATDQITDIWPVRALADLKRLFCDGSATRKGKLADLSPLAGMQLTDLTCGHTHVSDLSPLQGMPIRWLGLWTTPVTDLSPLAGMPLYHLQIEGTGVSDISPLRGMRIKRLSLSSTAVSDLSPLDGAPLTELSCHGTSITDLSPLAKAPLTVLHCAGTRVSDLSPLEGAPLTRLTVNRTRVSDLSPLAGMPLTYLNADETPIADLSPLKGMELTELYCAFTRVGDLTPLEGMPLRNFSCDEHPLRSNQGVIRKITSLETINGRPAAEILSSLSPVWQPTPEQQAFFDQVARLQAEEQVQTVAKKLMEVNPGFDGSVQHRIEADNVISLAFATDQITDIWPVRALADLRSLGFYGSGEGRGNGRLADLSPLAGMRLQQLECIKTPVSDLAPLAGMPLRVLRFNHTDVADLTPLAGMPLTSLHCYVTRVSDLAPVAGMPLANVDCSGTEISDLSPLAGTPLKYLNCSYTKVTDFSPLKGMPLTQLVCSGVPVSDIAPLAGLPLTSLSLYRAKVSDLAPLAGMELTAFSCDGAPVSDLSALENMPLKNLSCDEHQLRSNQGVIRKLASLKTINGQPAAEILSSLSPAWHPTPEQQAFFDQVAGLPAEEQVQAVTEKLMEVNPEFDGSGVWSRIEAKKVLEISFKTDHVTDIWPVRALADLTTLACRGSAGPDGTQRNGKLSDLSPLAGMALQRLYCTHNPQLSDLSPLAGMPLTTLECSYNRSLSDLSPLAGMPLTELALIVNPVSDLSPLRGMRLEALNCNGTRVSDLSPLHGMPLTSLSCGNTNVSDIAPLAGMPLTELHCGGTPISDLSPLKSLPLTVLRAYNTKISDLSPLEGMKLTSLSCANTNVSDLSPLEGMPLTDMDCHATPVSDLSPLAGMPLTELRCTGTDVSDLAPLQGMSVTRLSCNDTRVSDLSPLRGMPLTHLVLNWTCVSDYSPLLGMPLGQLNIDVPLFHKPDQNLLRSLTTINSYGIPFSARQKPEEFWQSHAARQEAAEAFAAETAKLPAEEQVLAISGQLRELNGSKARNAVGFGPVVRDRAIVAATLTLPERAEDITPLRALTSLKKLTIESAPHWLDLSPLNTTPLEELTCSEPIVLRNRLVLREFESLKTINGRPADESLDGLPAATAIDPDRRAAEHVLRAGGSVQLVTTSRELLQISEANELPDEPFAVTTVYFTNVPGITDEHLEPLSGLPRLGEVYLHDTQVTDAGMEHLANLSSLVNLYLYGTGVTGAGIARLAGLPRLADLNLARTPAAGSVEIDDLRRLPALDYLHVGAVTRERFLELAGVPSLRVLYFDAASAVTEADAEEFHNTNPHCRLMRGTTRLGRDPLREVAEWVQSIGGTMWLVPAAGDPLVKHLPGDPLPEEIQRIRTIDVHDKQLLDADLVRLTAAWNLNRLHLSRTKISDAGVAHLADCPRLDALLLNHHPLITDSSAESLAALPRLRVLELAGASITNRGAAALADMKSLRELNIGNTRIDGAALQEFAARSSLHTLGVAYCEIEDDDLAVLSEMSSLRALSLWRTAITDAGLVHLHRVAGLESLNLKGTKVTAAGVAELQQALPDCRINWDDDAGDAPADMQED